MMSMAELSAWIMFICGMSGPLLRAQLVALPPQVLGHFLEHVLEQQVAVQTRAVGQRAVLHGLLPAFRYLCFKFLGERGVALLGPFAQRDQVILEAHDRIAERPLLVVVFRS